MAALHRQSDWDTGLELKDRHLKHRRIEAIGMCNEQTLKRRGRLWFFPDDSMYVYYTPTQANSKYRRRTMTPDELRAARERLRQVAENMKDPDDASPISRVYAWDTIPGGPTYDGDRRAIIAAYLAEHHADDDTPIDEVWFNSIRTDYQHSVCFSWSRAGLRLHVDTISQRFSLPIPGTTRGGIRRLCRALGIELKEE